MAGSTVTRECSKCAFVQNPQQRHKKDEVDDVENILSSYPYPTTRRQPTNN
jgi:hypothetical protein